MIFLRSIMRDMAIIGKFQGSLKRVWHIFYLVYKIQRKILKFLSWLVDLSFRAPDGSKLKLNPNMCSTLIQTTLGNLQDF